MQANDINKLMGDFTSAGNGSQRAQTVKQAVDALTPEQKAALDDILSSPEKIKALLSTERAKRLMRETGKQGS